MYVYISKESACVYNYIIYTYLSQICFVSPQYFAKKQCTTKILKGRNSRTGPNILIIWNFIKHISQIVTHLPRQETNDQTPECHKHHTKSSNSFLVYKTKFNLFNIYQATILKYLVATKTVQELETWEAMSKAVHFPSRTLMKRKKK